MSSVVKGHLSNQTLRYFGTSSSTWCQQNVVDAKMNRLHMPSSSKKIKKMICDLTFAHFSTKK